MKQFTKHIKINWHIRIRLSTKIHYKNKFDLQKGNAKKSWQLIKEVLKYKSQITNPSTSFTLLDGSETSNPKYIANESNFIHVASTLVNDIPTTGNDPTEFEILIFFSADPQPPEEIVSLLRNIKSNTTKWFWQHWSTYYTRNKSPNSSSTIAYIQQLSLYWSGTTSTKNGKSNSNT